MPITFHAIPETARVKLIGHVRALPIINSFYVVDVAHPHAFTAGEVADIAAAFGSNWHGFAIDNYWSNQYSLDEVQVTALDTFTSPQAVYAVGHSGTDGSGAMPPEVCLTLSFYSTLRGRSGRNRIYISPIGSDKTDGGGGLGVGVATNLVNDWVAFLVRAGTTYGSLHPGATLTQVAGSPSTNSSFPLVSVQAHPLLRSQRRRQG